MKYIIYCLLLFGIFYLYSCCNNKNTTEKSQEKIDINTIEWNDKKDFNIEDIVKNIDYVILEDTHESMFSVIDKLIIKNDRIYILDVTGPHKLIVFNRNGKYLHRIGIQGKGPGEYSHSLLNFDVNDNDEVFLYDYAEKKMMTYDKEGRYISSIKSDYSFNDFNLLGNGQYLLSLDIFDNRNKLNKIMFTNDLKKINKTYFEFSKEYKNDKLNIRSFQKYQDKIAYMTPVNDTLFIFNDKGNLEKAYFFDFKNNKLPEKLKNSYEEAIKQRREGDYYTYIYNTPIIIGNYIIANIFLENQKCIAIFDVIHNTSTYEILTPEKFKLKNINFPLCIVDSSIIVSYIDSNLYDAISDKLSITSEIDEHLRDGGAILCLNKIE